MTAATFVKVWVPAASAEITEMANAGKRGKTCRQIRVTAHGRAAEEFVRCSLVYDIAGPENADEVTSKGKILPLDFDSIAAACHMANIPGLNVYDEEIKGIEAPRATLTAGNEKFSASADNNGIRIRDLTDRHNEPTSITPSSQSASRAYDLAKKVWAKVEKAQSYGEAGDILRQAGCKLHSYCAVD